MQTQEGRHAGAYGLRDHLAAFVLQELVDHHTIEAGHGADLPRGRGQEARKGRRAAEAIDDRLDKGGRVGAHHLGAPVRQELGDRQLRGGMDKDVVEGAITTNRDGRQALGEAGDHRGLKDVAQVVNDGGG